MSNSLILRREIWGLLVGLAIAGVLWIVAPYVERSSENARIAALYSKIQVGVTRERGAVLFLDGVSGQSVFALADRWMALSPPRFLQDQWVLVVCLADGKVIGKRVGTGDELSVTPQGAPAPEGTCPS